MQSHYYEIPSCYFEKKVTVKSHYFEILSRYFVIEICYFEILLFRSPSSPSYLKRFRFSPTDPQYT